jgi:UDP-glucuronate 4-epimerase
MRALVTGAAGFIGSHLVERLAKGGWEVRAVDCLVPYYDTAVKRANIQDVKALVGVDVLIDDLRNADLEPLLEGVDVVFHLAGQPGVRASWDTFDSYVQHNILATQCLLEAAKTVKTPRVVYASSSSIYGDAESYPTPEDAVPMPRSPYGVTKLAGEHLCGVYAKNFGVHTVSLRYFTVYGPRQRPDMAIHRLIESALSGEPFPMFGSGEQVRDFTFVSDIVAANIAAAISATTPGSVFNIAGGSSTSLAEVIDIIGKTTQREIRLDRRGTEAGDVLRTKADSEAAKAQLAWLPTISIEEGIALQVEWHQRRAGGGH